jgi:hypothetical protein
MIIPVLLSLIVLGYFVPLTTLLGMGIYSYSYCGSGLANCDLFSTGFTNPVKISSFANPYFSLFIAFIIVQLAMLAVRRLITFYPPQRSSSRREIS